MSVRLLVVTPARNEVRYLPHLIAALRAQTRTPDRWVVIDDGSTDGTADLVREQCADLPWVRVISHDGGGRRADASKALRVNEAIAANLTDDTEVIATFDADIVPPPHYLAEVELAFADDPRLGVTGGVCTYHDIGGNVAAEPFPPDIVPGGTTAIRRTTYDRIGGYWALPFGGLDVASCVAAQMHGWTSRHDPTLVCDHLRPMGTGEGQSARRGMFRRGREDYDLGSPWWFELGKVARWIPRRPFVTGALWMAGGYLRSMISRTPHTPSPEFIAFNRGRARARVVHRLRRNVKR